MKRWIHVGALLCVLSVVGCGGGEGAEGNAPDSTMSSKELKDLTADEVQAECDLLNAKTVLSKEDTCEFAGLMASAFGQTCDTVKAQCMSAADQAEQPEEAGTVSCMPPAERRAACSATVDEFEACMMAQADAVRALTCGSQLSSIDTPPAACDTLKEKCPTFLDAGGQGGATP